MPNAVIPNQAEINLMSSLVDHLGGTGKIKLYDNDVTPDEDTVLADLNEASYDGYAAQTITFGTPTIVAGKATLPTRLFEFFGPASAGPVDVYGWFMTDSSGGYLLMCGRFTTAPKTLADEVDSAKFDVTSRLFDPNS